jgi:hypothetical protein
MSKIYSEESYEVEDNGQVSIPRVVLVIDPGSVFQIPNPFKELLVEMGFTVEDIDRALEIHLDLGEAVRSLLCTSSILAAGHAMPIGCGLWECREAWAYGRRNSVAFATAEGG